MAIPYLKFNQNSQVGLVLRNGLAIEKALAELDKAFGSMNSMLNGADGSSDTHFATHVTEMGWLSTSEAHAAYNEINTLLAHFDASLRAALLQVSDAMR